MSNYAFADTLVSTQWLADHLNDPQVRVIEIDGNRTAYDSGHIPNAVLWNAPKDLLLPDWRVNVDKDAAADLFARSGIHHDTTVVFYSASLSANALGFWYMKLFGHRDARLLDGSRKKWVAENRPLTTAAPTVAPARYTPAEPNAELRALRAQVEAVIGKPDYAIVDTRRLAE